MSKYVRFLNADEEWLPVSACLSSDVSTCTKDDTDHTCAEMNDDVCVNIDDTCSGEGAEICIFFDEQIFPPAS